MTDNSIAMRSTPSQVSPVQLVYITGTVLTASFILDALLVFLYNIIHKPTNNDVRLYSTFHQLTSPLFNHFRQRRCQHAFSPSNTLEPLSNSYLSFSLPPSRPSVSEISTTTSQEQQAIHLLLHNSLLSLPSIYPNTSYLARKTFESETNDITIHAKCPSWTGKTHYQGAVLRAENLCCQEDKTERNGVGRGAESIKQRKRIAVHLSPPDAERVVSCGWGEYMSTGSSGKQTRLNERGPVWIDVHVPRSIGEVGVVLDIAKAAVWATGMTMMRGDVEEGGDDVWLEGKEEAESEV